VTALANFEKSSATPFAPQRDLMDVSYGGFMMTTEPAPADLKPKQSGTVSFVLPHSDRDHMVMLGTNIVVSTPVRARANAVGVTMQSYPAVVAKVFPAAIAEFVANNSQLCTWIVVTPKRSSTDSSLLNVYLDQTYGNPTADELASYETLNQPNWDGHDAEPITKQTLDYARRLLGIMPETLGPPDIAPAADGSIALEWVPERHNTLDKLFLDIGPGEEWRAYWMLRDGSFGRLLGRGYNADTSRVLDKLFDDLSK
jgi:hypothetical protein